MKTSYNITDFENAFKDIKTGSCIELVRKGHLLGLFLNHEDWIVRKAVAEQGYGLEKLINDKDWMVREAVAKQGFGLEKLINDKRPSVRKVAKYMKEQLKNTQKNEK